MKTTKVNYPIYEIVNTGKMSIPLLAEGRFFP
jgi:hypothetical protein